MEEKKKMIRATCLAALLVFWAAPMQMDAAASERFEISKDGHVRATPDQYAGIDATGVVTTGRGASVPYGTTPDWQNTLRRQVGALQIVDMNGDGWNDLVVGCYNSSSSPPYEDWRNMIYFNVGDQLEAEPSWISTDQVSTTDIQVGLIDNDSHPDIFAANGGTAFSASRIYFGGPSGPSTSPSWAEQPPVATFTVGAVLFDFDHDGDLDIFTANQGISPNPFRPMYGFRNNNGVVETMPFWQSLESSIQNTLAFADYDGDGWEDLAVSKWANFESGIYRNVEGVLQTAPAWTTGATGTDRGTAWTDFDDNGWPDLVIGANPSRLFSNDEGALSHTWTANPPFNGSQEVHAVDVNRDGRPDLAEVHFSDGRTHIYLNQDGALSTTPSWTYDAPIVANALAFGDLNGDGWPDLAIGYSGLPSILVFYATPSFVIGDMNCDGLVTPSDIAGFVLALTDPAAYAKQFPDCDVNSADVNGDGIVSPGDIAGFVELLTGRMTAVR